jgi:hypothetical protein
MNHDAQSRLDARVAQYYELRPLDFDEVERLELRQSAADEGFETALEIALRPIDARRADRLVLSFAGVLNLRLTPPERRVIQFVLLEIHCVRDRQWEGVSYSVMETENHTISFLCREFSANIE